MGQLSKHLHKNKSKSFSSEYSLEEALDIIRNDKELPETAFYHGREALARFVNNIITSYKNEIEKNDALAKELVEIIKEKCEIDFVLTTHHNWPMSYEPMASNVANLLVDMLSEHHGWPDSMDYRMINKRLFMSIDGEKQMDMVKNYVNSAPSPNSRYLAYSVFSNINFGEEYRNQLFKQTMQNVSHIGAYFKNSTKEMDAYVLEKITEILKGTRGIEDWQISNELSYCQKNCPHLFTGENILKILNVLSDEEKIHAAKVIVRNAEFSEIGKSFVGDVIKMIEETEHYKKVTDPLYEQSEADIDMTRLIKDLKEEYEWVEKLENRVKEQLGEDPR